MRLSTDQIFEFNGYTLDVRERMLLRDGLRIPLSDKPFDVLCVLVERSGSLVTKDELISQVWGETVVEDNNLDKSISRIRQVLADRGMTDQYIETVRGHGYRFVGNVDSTDTARIAARKPQEPQRDSIAVLPFSNFSSDPENEYFCDGLSEEILNGLAKISGLKVAARTSSFAFKNKEVDVNVVGRSLNVETVLEGSVRKDGRRLRITAQLINTSDGFHVWSETFDGEFKDIFELQERITLAVIDKLKFELPKSEVTAINRGYAANVDAYQMFLKGRFHVLKLRPDEVQTGISYFHKAIALDNKYALAYVGLALAYLTLPLAAELPVAEFAPKAMDAALRAIELDDELADAHGVLGWLLFWYEWDWPGSERACLKAIELDPRRSDPYEAFAHLLSNIGRHDEALRAIKKARELDPLNLRINALEGQFLFHAGHVDHALDQLVQTAELEPNFWLVHVFMANCLIEKGQFADAFSEAENARQLSGGSSYAAALVVYALARSGREPDALDVLNEMLEMSQQRNVPQFHFALAYVGLGDTDNALTYLENAFKAGDPKMAFLKVEPKLNDLHGNPRFGELLRKMNL